jgi:primase-like protein/bifunctional DNA primase/polymerase-like protein
MSTQTTPVVVTPPPKSEAIARKFVEMGGHVIFFPRGTKACKISGWEKMATNNLEAALRWAAQDPYANVGIVGKQDGLWGLDDDAGLLGEYIQKYGPLNTYGTNTVSGGKHYIFRQNAASWAMGNVSINDANGRELLSARVDDRYVVSAGSWAYPYNDTTKPLAQYIAINPSAPFVEAPQSLLDFIMKKAAEYGAKSKARQAAEEVRLYHEGGRNSALASRAAYLRQGGATESEMLEILSRLNSEQCVPPLPETEVKSIAKSFAKYSAGQDHSLLLNQWKAAQMEMLNAGPNTITDPSILEEVVKAATDIPPFDPAVMNGIMREYVELVSVGTTMQPQFAFLAVRVIIGALLTTKGVQFVDADTDSLIFGAAIGESGTSKGWSWRRVLRAFELGARKVGTFHGFGAKVMNGIDSGAGLKDYFFTDPESQPIIAYIDEVADLGEKADPKRNPGIITAIIELAENRSVSRTLAGKKRHKNNAYFALYIAGQHGEVYMQSLPNRSRLGLFDRMRPEYSAPVKPGGTPDISEDKAAELYKRLQEMMAQARSLSLDADARDLLDTFWEGQPDGVITKVRFKKHILVDSFMSAFSRGSSVVQVEDVERAIHIFQRELVIRQVHFAKEVPNRMAVFTDKMIELTEKMRRQLNRGAHRNLVALGRSDFEKHCGAYKSGEYDLFDRAFQMFSRAKLDRVVIEKGNGQKYEKYLPKPNDDGGALGW